MKNVFLSIFLMISLLACSDKNEMDSNKELNSIMDILAHPDDEAALAQIRAKYAAEGKKVYLVIAADGRVDRKSCEKLD